MWSWPHIRRSSWPASTPPTPTPTPPPTTHQHTNTLLSLSPGQSSPAIGDPACSLARSPTKLNQCLPLLLNKRGPGSYAHLASVRRNQSLLITRSLNTLHGNQFLCHIRIAWVLSFRMRTTTGGRHAPHHDHSSKPWPPQACARKVGSCKCFIYTARRHVFILCYPFHSYVSVVVVSNQEASKPVKTFDRLGYSHYEHSTRYHVRRCLTNDDSIPSLPTASSGTALEDMGRRFARPSNHPSSEGTCCG